MSKPLPTLVSFSGIDGAGKSTQIDALSAYLQKMGMRVSIIRFWDDIARLKHIRESAGHALFKGDKGIGTPEAPIQRKDKNVRSWPMTFIRLCIYFADAVSTRAAVKTALRGDADFVIFDRYCYDELANLNLQNPILRAYIRLLLKIVPRLNKSYLLDANPLEAHRRKPEYPIDFVHANRAAYLELKKQIGRFTVIPPMNKDAVAQTILQFIMEDLHSSSSPATDARCAWETRGAQTEKLDEAYTRPASS
jgi:thymidylate kinase